MGIRRVIALVLMVATFMMPLNLYAQKKISLIEEGSKAKYKGYLLSEELFLEYESYRKQIPAKDEECKITLSLLEEKLKLQYDFEIKKKDIELKYNEDQYKSRLDLKNDNIEYLESKLAANPPDFIDKWKFELGVITGTILTVVLVAIIDEVRYE